MSPRAQHRECYTRLLHAAAGKCIFCEWDAGTAATDICTVQRQMLRPCMSLSAGVLSGAAFQVYLQHLTSLLKLAIVCVGVQQLQLRSCGISRATGVIIQGLAIQNGLGWNGLLSLQTPHSSLLPSSEV